VRPAAIVARLCTRLGGGLRAGLAGLAALALVGCEDVGAPLVIGSKPFAESRVLAEIFAQSAEEAGIPVARRIPFGTTAVNLEGLRRGSIDLYPEYNGTGLVLLGQAPIADGDAATARVRELFAPLGLTWGARLGFDNNYALAVLADRTRTDDIATMSDLVARADTLRIGIEDDFLTRPLDGFQAMLSRYGMAFGTVETVPLDNRRELYDMLLDDAVDVILVYTSDGQIADFPLRLIEDDLAFFPVYEAAPLVRDAALDRHAALAGVLDALGGQLDLALMRRLNNRVETFGEDPVDVARDALVELGLVDADGAGGGRQPLHLAVTPSVIGDGEALTAMRAVRAAFPGRPVVLQPSSAPLDEIESGRARVALVPSGAFFEIDANGASVPREGFKAVGAVGDSFVHVLALDPDVNSLAQAETIASDFEASGSYRVASTLIEGLGLGARLVSVSGEDAMGYADALAGSGADVAVVVAPLGSAAMDLMIARGARLLPIEGWHSGNNVILHPYLREVRIPVGTYPGLDQPLETLATQFVIAGPRETGQLTVGDQGPGASFIPRALPLGGDTVRALNAALPGLAGIDPVLPQARALAPELPSPPASINPAFDVSALSVVVLVMLVWMGWLLFRPERR
jgi:osmoprotectant transport system permease protein